MLYQLRNIFYRPFVWISEVNNLTANISLHCADDAVYQIAYITKGPCLRTVTINGNWFVTDRLINEIRDDTAVIFFHIRAVCIEYTHNAAVNIELCQKRIHVRFSAPF